MKEDHFDSDTLTLKENTIRFGAKEIEEPLLLCTWAIESTIFLKTKHRDVKIGES